MDVQDNGPPDCPAPQPGAAALLAGLDDAMRAVLRAHLRLESWPAAQIVCEENAPGDTLYIVHSGQVKVSKQLEQGQEQVLRCLGAGEFFGEMALLEDRPRSARVSTLMPTTLLVLTRERFNALLEQQPRLATHFLKAISAQLRLRYREQERLLHEKQTLVDALAAKNRALQQALEELQAALATVAEHERMQRDLEIARQIQHYMLPLSFPETPHVQVHAVTEPATWVGGDLYDALCLDAQRLGMLLGDVSGKGIPAAMQMARLMGEFRACVYHSARPDRLMQMLNGLLCQRNVHFHSFVTAQYLLLEPEQRRVQFICAGHPPILLRHANRQIEYLGAQANIPLGIDETWTYRQEERVLAVGDTLLCYSDGIYERHDAAGLLLGLPGLAALFAAAPEEPQAIIATLRAAVEHFGAGSGLHDDTTLLCARLL
ncbi:MAG: PP2C family protein-serine/threonine phosphatase [Candidatus Tectimicrobiota bacterium]